MISWMYWKSNRERFDLLDGDYTSENADGSRDLEWGWYPVKCANSVNGWAPTGRTRKRNGKIEHEHFAGVWFGRDIARWFVRGDDENWYHARD